MQRIPLEGKTMGNWTVLIRDMNPPAPTRYLCRCACGTERVIAAQTLRTGESRSCGCLRAKLMRQKQTTHGHYDTPTYRSWRAMLARCSDAKHRQFKDYGGRGVRVCDAWKNSFESFLADMGERPPDTSIDRIDTNGHYQPGNCRWATRIEQNRNKRTAKKENK
ncbi:hypothetical protein OYT13_16870 [Pandoraea sp. XJJ-1]|uniref:hypothetical protein n=1 Tax=Pandoraea sp. XJJ-1 TaxID=3002643 RepID=UPI002282014B|nr:hypothetical protein [Pandoraea sp. XJJ-1]WAL81511.1 hypothetical protein OYT13_16870 [Pandoraea sp. XJJ-1]